MIKWHGGDYVSLRIGKPGTFGYNAIVNLLRWYESWVLIHPSLHKFVRIEMLRAYNILPSRTYAVEALFMLKMPISNKHDLSSTA